MDPFESFKVAQKQAWVHFAPFEAITTPCAARLVKRAGVRSGQRVLDAACGTGVVSVTAARLSARVTGLDLTPELLERARENARIAGVEIDWHEGDVEKLPFDESAFDVVLSEFGHMFAPRPEVAVGEMLRVLKPGGTIAFSTWPPELFVGRMFALTASYLPPPPSGVASPPLWGDPNIVRQRLGSAVKDVLFDRATMLVPALSPSHHRKASEKSSGTMVRLIAELEGSDPAKLEKFRREYDALAAEYFEDNLLRQDYLITRATKI
ncbi:MAG TPA: class I SAM-dependent methyltransferase [Candidatus Acidoferrales bacterium]|jgi:SAM-dependent methyltransferase|nr:class I SAM-dependent methyltransferase [Candidatus Acidoferrales bacterium]